MVTLLESNKISQVYACICSDSGVRSDRFIQKEIETTKKQDLQVLIKKTAHLPRASAPMVSADLEILAHTAFTVALSLAVKLIFGSVFYVSLHLN